MYWKASKSLTVFKDNLFFSLVSLSTFRKKKIIRKCQTFIYFYRYYDDRIPPIIILFINFFYLKTTKTWGQIYKTVFSDFDLQGFLFWQGFYLDLQDSGLVHKESLLVRLRSSSDLQGFLPFMHLHSLLIYKQLFFCLNLIHSNTFLGKGSTISAIPTRITHLETMTWPVDLTWKDFLFFVDIHFIMSF